MKEATKDSSPGMSEHGGLKDMKRNWLITAAAGAAVSISGCQTPSLGGLAFWNKSNSSPVASTSPDVGKQKFNGLTQQFGGEPTRPIGQARGTGTALGGQPEKVGFFTSQWRKTTAAVTGTLSTTKAAPVMADDDPLRLDRVPTKIGPDVYVSAARLLENQNKFDEAEAKYKEALQSSPTNFSALIGLARLYDRQGRGPQAVQIYQRTLETQPSNALVWNDLGLCYRRLGQNDKSMEALAQAVKLQPENVKYHNNLAAALLDVGRGDEALDQLRLANTPAVAHYNMGYLLQQKGQRADAARHLQEALALDPALGPARQLLLQMGMPAQIDRSAGMLQNASSRVAGAAYQAADTLTRQADLSNYHVGDENLAGRQPPVSQAGPAIYSLPPAGANNFTGRALPAVE